MREEAVVAHPNLQSFRCVRHSCRARLRLLCRGLGALRHSYKDAASDDIPNYPKDPGPAEEKSEPSPQAQPLSLLRHASGASDRVGKELQTAMLGFDASTSGAFHVL